RSTWLPIATRIPLRVRARPHFLHDTVEGQPLWRTSVMALEMVPRPGAESLSDDALLAIASELADDLTLLVSFVSRGWVVWHQYHFLKTDCIKTHTRHFRTPGRVKPGTSDGPIAWGKTRDFLRVALPRLRKRRAEASDITMALTYCVIADSDGYVDEQF